MPILHLELTKDHEALIAQLIESGQFHNADEVLREGLRLVEEDQKPDTVKEEMLRKAIQPGLDDLSQGHFVTLKMRDEIAGHLQLLGKRAAKQFS